MLFQIVDNYFWNFFAKNTCNKCLWLGSTTKHLAKFWTQFQRTITWMGNPSGNQTKKTKRVLLRGPIGELMRAYLLYRCKHLFKFMFQVVSP